MSIVSQTKAALQFAKRAHDGQLRAIGPDTGLPYFDTHVLRVVNSSPEWARPAAALHDVLEDTETRVDDLPQLEFSQLEAVELLTRNPAHTYHQYIMGLVEATGLPGRIARAVKLADLMDNLNTLPEGSLRARYIKAMSHITKAIIEKGEGNIYE